MIDLAYTPPKEDREKMGAVSTPSSDESTPQYPSLRFNGEQASKAGLTDCKFGEEYELTVRVKATRIDASSIYPANGDSKDKPEIQFDVLACEKPTEVSADDGEDEPAGDDQKPKKSKQRIMSPKDMGLDKYES